MPTLYRKYRPKNFSEVIGQSHIVTTLSNAVKHERISQAYLFTGPRGTGKTSIARIFAKTINCTDLKEAITCEKCDTCRLIGENKTLDIIEIDAASNTGVDNIRELRETVALPPTTLKYKVYIIDEVHMLSTGAFNALLKTLEEPPAHVIFILATTEIHKVPETIISRCQRFDFSRLPIQSIIEKLSFIAKLEKIKIDKDSLEMIAIAAEGGMRDAESLFSQVISLEDKNITVKEVEEILGTTDRKIAREVASAILTGSSTEAIRKVNELLEDGFDLGVFNKSLINYLRQLMLLKVSPELKAHFTYEMTSEQIEEMARETENLELAKIVLTLNLLIEAQNKISAFILPQLPLEIAIIKATNAFPDLSQAPKSPTTSSQDEPKKKFQKPIEPVKIEEKTAPTEIVQEISIEDTESKTNLPSLPASNIDIEDVRIAWKQFQESVKKKNYSLGVLLSNCQAAEANGSEVVIATPFEFYKEKLNDPTNRLTVEEVLGSILGLKACIRAATHKELGLPEPKRTTESSASEESGTQDSLLSSAMEIIGGQLVEE